MPALRPHVRSADLAEDTAPLPAAGFDGGDDLVRARRFCDAAHADMLSIIDAASAADRDAHDLADALSRIQQGAKRARARSVYRSAQDVLALIHSHGPHMPIDWGQVDGRLFVLNKLLTQYESGLSDVEAQQPARAASNPPPASRMDAVQAHREASHTLRALLPVAEAHAPAELSALTRLLDMAYSPEPAPRDEAGGNATLDAAMPELVQRLLSHGRDFGKTVSVSYNVDGVELSEAARDALCERVWDALAPLVAASLPLQGVGHLGIAVQQGRLHVSGSGFAPFELPVHAPGPTPAPPARITDSTEADLRAQLYSLMDMNNPGPGSGPAPSSSAGGS